MDLEDADLVIALKQAEHYAMMAEQFPAWAERITYWHIDDLDCATADDSLPVCQSLIEDLVDRLAAQEQANPPASVAAGGVGSEPFFGVLCPWWNYLLTHPKGVQSLHSIELRGFCIGKALLCQFSYGICEGAILKESCCRRSSTRRSIGLDAEPGSSGRPPASTSFPIP